MTEDPLVREWARALAEEGERYGERLSGGGRRKKESRDR
jgi:hypothetical protein